MQRLRSGQERKSHRQQGGEHFDTRDILFVHCLLVHCFLDVWVSDGTAPVPLGASDPADASS